MYTVDSYNLVVVIHRIKLFISLNNVQARKLNEPFGYLVSSLANLGSR